MNTAVIFTGQGSQFVGMGRDLAEANPSAAAIFREADGIFPGLSELIFSGPEAILNETSYTQPAVYVLEAALWQTFRGRWPDKLGDITCMAGHSLGEYTALYASGALTFEQGLRLVMERGQAMRDAGEKSPGGMLVILGLDDAAVKELTAELGKEGALVWAANYNAPGQIVLAGNQANLELARQRAIAAGAKRCLPLAISVACHTPLMQEAGDRLAQALAATPISQPRIPVIANVDAVPLSNPEDIRAALLRQLVSPVRWTESVITMRNMGVVRFIELGPKQVLTGLVQRTDRSLQASGATDAASIDALSWEPS